MPEAKNLTHFLGSMNIWESGGKSSTDKCLSMKIRENLLYFITRQNIPIHPHFQRQKLFFLRDRAKHLCAFNFVIFCHPWRNKNLFDNFSLTVVSSFEKKQSKDFSSSFSFPFFSLHWNGKKRSLIILSFKKKNEFL